MVSGIFLYNSIDKDNKVDMSKLTEEEIKEVKPIVQKYSGMLLDVEDGNASGGVDIVYDTNGKYKLKAFFENLENPDSGFYYEGWLVRNEPLSVISTGRTEIVEGELRNIFESEKDLTDHRIYILTLEPDDGDPAPATHILQGEMMQYQ